jgi:periplasmic divalent cation tolerance protein
MRRSDLIVVVTSVGSEEQALDIAHELVRNRQAACVNLLPNVHSIYRWKGRVCDDGEFLLLIKTRAREFTAVCNTIQKINTYELPEILAYRVDEASPAFEDWISRTTERPKKKLRKKVKGAAAALAKPPAPIPIRRRASSSSR